MKDTYYFSHDYNARTDAKIKKLLANHGYLGYGLFWAIIEDLYNNANALRLDYSSIAYDLRSDYAVIKSIIEDFDLFQIEGETFGSLSVERRLNEREEKSKSASNSANKRWEKHRNSKGLNANALPTQSDSNAIKEKKGKESKGNKSDYLEQFEVFRKLFGGTKRGLETEFKYLQAKHEDWETVIPILHNAVKKEIQWRANAKGFVPEWKNLKTWIYNRSWEQEFETTAEQPKPANRPVGTYDKEYGG